ncbi:MAG: D-aminoacyl-tRNA deacylase [Chlamydiae bacterium]|nr:D-aminoacyl-tRNA deacylase [Chlamydiota bacterium]
MRVLIQRVKSAEVLIGEKPSGKIGKGLLLFLGIHKDDTPKEVEWLVEKVRNLRVFPNDEDKMHFNLEETGGEALVVSQFTLYGTLTKGRRPEFTEAALPEQAFLLYEQFVSELSETLSKPVQTGVFGARMEVSLVNDGPVTFLLEPQYIKKHTTVMLDC